MTISLNETGKLNTELCDVYFFLPTRLKRLYPLTNFRRAIKISGPLSKVTQSWKEI